MKLIPYGTGGFERIIHDGYCYIDKTRRIKTVEDQNSCKFFARPRGMDKMRTPAICILRMCAMAICALMGTSAEAQRIAVLCDIHVSPDNENSRQLRLAIDEINSGDYDMVVVDGDLTNEGSDAELTYVKSLLDSIRHRQYTVPGNHENTWSQSATKTFLDLWGSDRFVAKAGDYDIVGINCGPYMKMGDGHVKQEDLHWLRHTLDSVGAPGRKVISINHYPARKDDLDNYATYQRLLEQYPTVMHVNGHYHRWDRYMAGDIDAVTARALGVDGTYGYTILEFGDGRCTVLEKVIGEAPAVRYEIAERTDHRRASQDTAAEEAATPEEATRHCRLVWEDEASVFTRLAFDAGHVYFGTSLGEAKAVDKNTGETAWSVRLGAPLFSRPVVLPGGKVAYPCSGGIKMVSAADGADLGWLPGSRGPYVADGIVAGNLYIQGGYRHISAYDCASGEMVWSHDSIGNYCQGSPAVSGDDLVFGAWDTYLRCLDLGTGLARWQWSNGQPNNLLSPGNVVPVVTDDKVITVAPDRYMTAIDRQSGETLWRDNSHRYRESLGRSADGRAVYAKTMDGELVAVDAVSDSYDELWTCDMGIGYDHAPCIVAEAGGVIYAGSRRGVLTAVSAATHELLWQETLGTSEINGIDTDPTDGSVWVSLVEGRIAKIE